MEICLSCRKIQPEGSIEIAFVFCNRGTRVQHIGVDIRSRSEDLNYIVDYISTPKPSGVTEIFDSSI